MSQEILHSHFLPVQLSYLKIFSPFYKTLRESKTGLISTE